MVHKPISINKSLPSDCKSQMRGFALVSTLILMVLLVLITMGLLGLSTITLRASSQDSATAKAQANARMALLLALGELQRHAGPDMRVTAPASIFHDEEASSSSNLAITGVWKSWEGSDHVQSGAAAARPIPPEYASKRQSASSAGGRFLDWLVSKPFDVSGMDLISDDPDWSLGNALQEFVRNTPFDGYVPLVSGGSLSAGDPREVHVVPVTVNNGSGQLGSYAWWIGGENQKARLPVPHKPADNNDVAGWSVLVKSHAIPDPSALALDALLAADGATKATKAMSLNTVSLLAPQIPNALDPAKQFHDLSPYSIGLLTNTATGGWRKDLSLFTENWNNLPPSGVEVFRITPDSSASAIATMTRPTMNTVASVLSQGSVFYPWSTYRTPVNPANYGGRAKNYTSAVSSWHNLMSYATLYKQLTLPGGRPTIAPRAAYQMRAAGDTSSVPERTNLFNFLHNVRVFPVLGRLHIVYSYRSVFVPATGKYRLQVGVTPVCTIWNPYNVDLQPTPVMHSFSRSLPPAFRFRIGENYSDIQWNFVFHNPSFNRNSGRTGWMMLLTPHLRITTQNLSQSPRSLLPGETMMFNFRNGSAGYYPDSDPEATMAALDLYTNYANLSINGVSEFDAGDLISLDVRFDSFCDFANDVGVFYEMTLGHETRDFSRQNIKHDPVRANLMWPIKDAIHFPSHTVESVTGPGMPFLSLTYGPRTMSGSNFASKGYLQTTPFMLNVNAGPRMENGTATSHYTGNNYTGGVLGANHPVNTAMDLSFYSHTSWIDDSLPNCSQDGRNNGYLVSGTQAGDGLTRIAVAELPLRPLASLAELQHWDLRMDNPAPPHQFNIIANSDAQPMFAPNAIGGANAIARPAINLQHDDSYCANHLLFDDWFFSTIAPQPTTFGPNGKTLQETFTAFVRDGAPLDNRAYRPIPEDRGISAAEATALFNTKVNGAESYRGIASRLEVDGMFNVNSTSVKAWRALLGHARNQRMPYYNNNGNIVLSAPADFTVSRTTVASDVAAGENGSSGSFAGASEFSGYRVFSDEMLDQLAVEMVNQVSKRGPFLSLSEFVNRQLTDYDAELALAGAVQTALNVLAANGNDNLNPYSVLHDESPNAGLSVLTAAGKDAGSGFNFFPEASEGKSAYGLPGWPRQADILRPLAPILSARDDTFTIRSYGDARDAAGKIIARAWCEAVVRRTRDFVSPTEDAADITGPPAAPANQTFGRKFQIISFRWLHADEV